MDKNTAEERKAAAAEWCDARIVVVKKALQVAIDRGGQVRIDLLKFDLYGWKDCRASLDKKNLRDLYCDILIATEKRYPRRSNRYYWTKLGQPKLWKFRKRIGHHLTKPERHFLWPMTYKELR